MSDIGSIFAFINNYGIEKFIILLLIIFSVIPQLKRIYKELKGSTTFNKSPNIDIYTKNSLVVNDILDQILLIYGADRACVYEYHNGGHNLAGVSFAKVSMTHERTRMGVTPAFSDSQNIPCGFLSFLTSSLVSYGHLYIPDIDTLSTSDSGFYQTMIGKGVLSMYVMSVSSIAGDLIGYVCIQYTRQKMSLPQKDLENIKPLAYTIGGCIMSDEDSCIINESPKSVVG